MLVSVNAAAKLSTPISIPCPNKDLRRIVPTQLFVPQLRPNRAEHGGGKGSAIGDGRSLLIHELMRQRESRRLHQGAAHLRVLLELRAHRLLGERVVLDAAKPNTLATEHDRVVRRRARSGALRLEAPEREDTLTLRRTLRKLQPLPKPLHALAADLAPAAAQGERRMRERREKPRAPVVRVARDVQHHAVSTGQRMTRRSAAAATTNARTASAVAATIGEKRGMGTERMACGLRQKRKMSERGGVRARGGTRRSPSAGGSPPRDRRLDRTNKTAKRGPAGSPPMKPSAASAAVSSRAL